jgi:nicotinamidase/pyrazinamidase
MVDYDSRAALIVADIQNDFADPAGSLAVRGGDGIVPRVNQEIRNATESGGVVVLTQDWHPESTPHFAKDGGIWPVHCVAGTWGAELLPALEVSLETPRVHKGSNGEDGYSGFTMRDPMSGEQIPTQLDSLLRARGVERVAICGLATDYCVKATALDAIRLGYQTTVLTDAIAAVELEPGDGERAIGQMQEAGARLA